VHCSSYEGFTRGVHCETVGEGVLVREAVDAVTYPLTEGELQRRGSCGGAIDRWLENQHVT
jgi:hypothetical protein